MAQAADSDSAQDGYEEKITELFADVIGSGQRLDVTTNFFAAGGASIGALRVIAGIEREFGVSVAPRMFFAQPTPRDLAVLVRESV